MINLNTLSNETARNLGRVINKGIPYYQPEDMLYDIGAFLKRKRITQNDANILTAEVERQMDEKLQEQVKNLEK